MQNHAQRGKARGYTGMPRPLDVNREALTPFARKLLDFMWDQRPSWTKVQLAHALMVPRSTVDSWFKGTLPKGPALHALLRVTRWDEDELLRLTGYDEMPPPDLPDFLLTEVAHWPHFDASTRANVAAFLRDAYAWYDTASRKRPPRRARAPEVREAERQPTAQEQASSLPSLPSSRTRHMLVSSSK